jgi:hypothetical protein
MGADPEVPLRRAGWRGEGLNVAPTSAEVLLIWPAQLGDDPPLGPTLRADGLAERPVLVDRAIQASAIIAQDQALLSPGRLASARGDSTTKFHPLRIAPPSS